MDDKSLPVTALQTGELSNCETNHSKTHDIQCDTFAGLVHVEWDDQPKNGS